MSADLDGRTGQNAGVTDRYCFTCGRGRGQTVWDTRRAFTWAELTDFLTHHEVGEKHGPCIVPATFRGTARKMDFAEQIDVAMLDADSGYTPEEIANAIELLGWRAIISSTHSHLTSRTKVRASAYEKWLARNPGKGPAEFLAASKHMLPRVVDGARIVERITEKEGEKDVEYCIFEHHPCPKYRVVIPLAAPWRAVDFEGQPEANAAWRRAVTALAHALGLQHDQSCTDTSRLFYLPRHPKDVHPESRVIDGEPCDVWELPDPPEVNGKANGHDARQNGLGLDAHAEYVDAGSGEVVDLTVWAGHYAERFEIAKALQARSPGVFGTRQNGVKRHIECPFECEHTSPGRDGTYVVDASDIGRAGLTQRNSGFYIGCSHNACQGRDRLDFLAGMLNHGWLQTGDLTDERFLRPKPNGAGHNGSFAENIGDYDDEFGAGQQQQQAQPQKVIPLDLFGDTALSGCPDLDPEVLPKIVRDYARDQAERFGVDLGFVAMPALTALAAALPDGWKIRPKRRDTEWRESARIWSAVVADIGAMKSPVLTKVTSPLEDLEKEWAAEDEQAMEEYQLASAAHERQVERYAKAAAKGESVEKPVKPTKPPERRLLVNDATVESLSEILKENPQGVLGLYDELVGFFASFDAYRDRAGASKDRADWLKLFNGGFHKIDRIKRGRFSVPNWSACLLGGIQPGPMRKLADKIDLHADGLLQRFIMIHGRAVGQGVDREPDPAAVRLFRKLIRDLRASHPTEEPIVLSEDAHAVRERVGGVARDILALPTTPDAFKGHLNKWGGLFARLLLLFHMVETIGSGLDPQTPVSGETARRVGVLLLDYLLPHAARFYNDTIGHGEAFADARWVAGLILSDRMRDITARDVYRAYRKMRGHEDEIARIFTTLHVAGWIEPRDEGRGKPVRFWDVNPEVHRIFTARAEQERGRRAAARENIRRAARNLGLDAGDAP